VKRGRIAIYRGFVYCTYLKWHAKLPEQAMSIRIRTEAICSGERLFVELVAKTVVDDGQEPFQGS